MIFIELRKCLSINRLRALNVYFWIPTMGGCAVNCLKNFISYCREVMRQAIYAKGQSIEHPFPTSFLTDSNFYTELGEHWSTSCLGVAPQAWFTLQRKLLLFKRSACGSQWSPLCVRRCSCTSSDWLPHPSHANRRSLCWSTNKALVCTDFNMICI